SLSPVLCLYHCFNSFFLRSSSHLDLHSFPTRRSSDLWGTWPRAACTICTVKSSGRMSFSEPLNARPIGERAVETITASVMECLSDRKSTRLNSSHVSISYAVFCLKKKIKDYTSFVYIG